MLHIKPQKADQEAGRLLGKIASISKSHWQLLSPQ